MQQGLEQRERCGEQKIVLRQLNRRFGLLPTPLEQGITKLSLARLEALSDALLELENLEDLRNWLKKRAR